MADTSVTNSVGRRKTAVCRVYLRPGSGKWNVNKRTLGDYFPRPTLVSAIQQPFTATDTLGQYDVRASVDGGGLTGQAGALRLAVAKALVKIDEGHRRKLRDLGREAPEDHALGVDDIPVLLDVARRGAERFEHDLTTRDGSFASPVRNATRVSAATKGVLGQTRKLDRGLSVVNA
jgi:small subunit ribosomal protein S9